MSNTLQMLTVMVLCICYIFQEQLILGLKVKKEEDALDQSNEFSCDRKMETEIDKSISRLIVIGQRNLRFPENDRQVRPYCNLAQRTFDLVQAYADKCVPDFGRATMKLFMHVLHNELKAVCKAGKLSRRARELLSAAPCANAGLKNWERCYKELINKFTGTMNVEVKMRIPMSCCNFHQLIHCLTEEAEEVKQCTKKTIDYLTKYVNKLIDPILMMLCMEYSEPSDRCDKLVKLTPNRTKSQRKYYSFVRPLINIALSLENDEEFIKEFAPKIEKNGRQ